MPAASSGKRSFKGLTARGYEGKSASQQVKAAQWTGQLEWNNADHPSSKKKQGGYSWPQPEVDFNKPWFTLKDGEFYCDLCGAWATPEHVASDRHSKRAENPAWYGYGVGEVLPDEQFNKPWFTSKGAGEYYCELCGAVATEGHIMSDKHQKRAAHPEWYGFESRDPAGSVAESVETLPEPWIRYYSEDQQKPWYFNPITKVATWKFPGEQSLTTADAPTAVTVIPDEYNFPWFQQRDGDWYCNLCGCWATDGHIVSQRHQKRATWPSYYGFPDSGALEMLPQPVSNQPPMHSYTGVEQVPLSLGPPEQLPVSVQSDPALEVEEC